MKTPILTTVYRILAALLFLAAIAAAAASFTKPNDLAGLLFYAAALAVGGIVSLGIAQVVHLVAKIEYNTRESMGSHQILKSLQAIARNTAKEREYEKEN